MSLRNRLLASYLLLLGLTLSVIVVALLVTTDSQPAPPQPTYQKLWPLARGLTVSNLVEEFIEELGPGVISGEGGGSVPEAGSTPGSSLPERLLERLGDRENRLNNNALQTGSVRAVALQRYAETRSVRVLEVNLTQDEVLFDSNLSTAANRQIRMNREDYAIPELAQNLPPDDRAEPLEQVFGRFTEDGVEWLFSGIIVQTQDTSDLIAAIVAEPRPITSLQAVLADFGTSLARPLLQTTIISLFTALVMSVLISRTVARPLQAASAAAQAVAEGDLSQHVPITGPTEVRAVARAFNRMSAQVRATQQAQQDFLANVSHDLKTPLTSIQGYSQAIVDGAAREPRQAAEIIHEEAARLNRMVNELTDLARIQAGKFSMKTEDVDVGLIASEVARKLAVVAENKGIALDNRTLPMPIVQGDGDRLVQVFTNLLSNAIKYTPSGGRVRIQTQATEEGVEVLIRDTGIGIPKEDLPRVFERFYQVDKARGPARGTGLGLAITNEIVQAHGGKIYVESVEGNGTTFTVWLPRARVTEKTLAPVS
ncbi:MAG: hypothetical protein OHK0046_14780 [Anaerolineae bacterium]